MTDIISTYYPSPNGLLRISGTEEYICEVMFVDKIQQEKEDPNQSCPRLLLHCMEQLNQFFNGQRTTFNLPLQQNGTKFQQEVWHWLTGIEYGKTISYLELAKRIGNPDATRAVAAANGKNRISIIVPCHRVIGSDHQLTGYSGGLWRKKWLLELEAKVSYGVQTLF